ncbi:MAG: FMN-binding glutamate synthase family protein [Candidatus Omnitrophica bacterium]|nr:FMN-binding glutamate synthase family protein [Candidatus Omnitrophota bacterium]
MSFSKPNASPATNTRNRVNPSPVSGICVTCLDGCVGFCEVAKSAIRGREMIYPQPFGKVVAGSEKDYPIDFSHFNVQGTCVGAVGIAADPDKATFPAVDVSTEVGGKNKIKLGVPFFTGALGSTEVARINWEENAVGAAISGTIVVVGENVCGMDHKAEIKNGRVVRSPELERRVNSYKKWHSGMGTIVVQYNVEDGRLGVPEYALELGVEAIEPKWGQGAKDIGGEVKLPSIERALELKKRGYIVYPDPEDPVVQKAYKEGAIREFERHSRLGMVEEDGFYKEVARLRKLGFKYVTLKTGAYRPADLARAVKFSSEAKIDLLTVDGASGGTGMSPWRMMNEWGIPTVELECLLYQMLKKVEQQGKYIPPVAMAGGLALEDHIFKAIALGAPFVKAICMGRATFSAAMAAKTVGNLIKEGKVPVEYKKYGDTIEQVFVAAEGLKSKYGKEFKNIPVGAIGMYTYYERLATGLKQFMAGERKFALKHITRDDIVALTREASEISGIPYVMDCDKEIVDQILGHKGGLSWKKEPYALRA